MPSTSIQLFSIYDGTRIETEVFYPQTPSSEAMGVVISHPYGPLGGNKDNNVVFALMEYFARQGCIVATFNFRGCGRSGGRTSWTAEPEVGDYTTVLNHVASGGRDPSSPESSNKWTPPRRLIICGYSYGSMVASAIPSISYPSLLLSYIFISYPLSVTWFLSTVKSRTFTAHMQSRIASANSGGPRLLFVIGDRDQFTGLSTFEKWIKNEKVEKGIDVKISEGSDHFWFGKEKELVNTVGEWVNRV